MFGHDYQVVHVQLDGWHLGIALALSLKLFNRYKRVAHVQLEQKALRKRVNFLLTLKHLPLLSESG